MKRQIIIAVVAILVLVAGAVAGYFGGGMLAPHPKSKDAAKEVAADAAAKPPPDTSLFYDLPEMLVTLKDPINGTRCCSSRRASNARARRIWNKLKEYLPRVLDVFQIYVSGLTIKDLRGTKNLELLRSQLRDRVSAAIAPGKVSMILFHGLAVQ